MNPSEGRVKERCCALADVGFVYREYGGFDVTRWDQLYLSGDVDATMARPSPDHVYNVTDPKWPIVFSMLAALQRESAVT